jgi:hypothetical protein
MKSLVMIPYGARENIDFLVDTVDSVNFHLESEKKDMVVIDDSEGEVKKNRNIILKCEGGKKQKKNDGCVWKTQKRFFIGRAN